MRHYLTKLQARGDVVVIDRECDPVHEVAAAAKAMQKFSTKAVLFTNVKGSKMPVVLNVFSDHDRLKEIIRCGQKTFCERLEEEIALSATMNPWMEEDSSTSEW